MSDETVLVELYEMTFGVLETADDVVTIVSTDMFGVSSSSSGGGAALTIQDEGSDLTARTNLNFVGSAVAVTDDSGNDATVVTVSGGATDLTYTASTRVVASSTGTDATLTLADGTNPGLMASADYTKLSGVESGATADQTAAEILAALLTVDGAGSGLDADTLDGTSSAGFATASHNHSGVYDPAGTAASAVSAHEADTTSVHGIADTSALLTSSSISDTAYDATSWNGVTTVAPSKNAVRDKIETLVTGVSSVDGNTGAVTAAQLLTSIKTVDGAGSGLDADLLDGQSSAAFQTGPLTGDVTTSGAAATLATVYAGSSPVGGATAIPVITIDGKGRITATSTATPTVADPPTVAIIARQVLK